MPIATKTRSQLVKEADKYFSIAVRYRDGFERAGEWWAKCITCPSELPIKRMHAGHFMSRRHSVTRYDEENVNAQCAGCNTFRAGEQYKYGLALDFKYGDGTAKELHYRASQTIKLTSDDLRQIIEDSKKQIKFYEKEA